MNKNQLKELENDFDNLIKKYKLKDTIILSNKVIVKPKGYTVNDMLSSMFTGLENILTEIITKMAENNLYPDYDLTYDTTMKEIGVIQTILKMNIKRRIEEVKSKHIKYN